MPKKVVVDFELKYKEAEKNLDKFKKEYAELQKEVVDANEKTADSIKDVGKEAEKSGKGLKKVGSAIGGLAKFTGVLFIVQKAFEFISEAISNNQTVMDSLRVGFETAQIIFNQVANAIFSNTENFDALGRVMSNLLTIALTPIKLAFNGIKAALLGAQLAWEQSWFGSGDEEKIASLKEQLKEVGDEVVEIGKNAIEAGGNIVKDFGEAVSEAGNIGSQVVDKLSDISVKAIAENVKANEQLKKAAAEARVANQGLIEDYDRQAEQQRQIRDNDLKSIADRITANETLKAKLTEQKELMLENANAILAAAEAQFKLTGLDEDNLALQEAKNELKAVEAQIEGFMSEQESNRVALLKEKMELQQSIDEGDAMRRQSERAFNAEMEMSETLRLEMLLANLEVEREAETERLRFKRDSYQKGTQAYIDANNELMDYEQANAQQQAKIDKDLNEAKFNQTTKTLGALSSIVGKNSKFGKAIALVSAIRETFKGANVALGSAPPPANFIMMAAVIAGGMANVKSILSTKDPAPPPFATGAGGGSTAVSIPSPPPPVIPDVNTVASSGMNQLADAIGEQTQQPVQAYVVSNDVTTAQSMERNIVDGASIG